TSKIGILTHMQDPKAPPQWEELKRAAKDLEITIIDADVDAAEKIDDAFQKFASERVDVVLVLQTTLLLNQGRRIAEAALGKRLPTVFGYRENVVAGRLLHYALPFLRLYRPPTY